MEPLEVFYSEALKHFKEAGGSEDEFKWFIGTRLAWFGLYRNEVKLRLKMTEEIFKRIQGRILDVGSGTGFPALVMALSENAGEVIGLEKDPYMVEFSKRLEKYTANLRFIGGNFLEENLGIGRFDTVVLMYILHDFEPLPFLERAFGLLKPGGKILVGDFDLNGLRLTVINFALENGLRIVENMTLGKAFSHQREVEAFLLVLERTHNIDDSLISPLEKGTV